MINGTSNITSLTWALTLLLTKENSGNPAQLQYLLGVGNGEINLKSFRPCHVWQAVGGLGPFRLSVS